MAAAGPSLLMRRAAGGAQHRQRPRPMAPKVITRWATGHRPHSTKSNGLLRVLPEVSAAVAARRPVVALESTIVAHGMPHPQNLELSREVAAILREKVRYWRRKGAKYKDISLASVHYVRPRKSFWNFWRFGIFGISRHGILI
jgi:hypothetical protein